MSVYFPRISEETFLRSIAKANRCIEYPKLTPSFYYSSSIVIHNHIPFTPAHGYDKVHERDLSIVCHRPEKIQKVPHIVQEYGEEELEIPYTHIR